MLYPGGRKVREDPVAADAEARAVVAHCAVDRAKPLSFGLRTDPSAERTDELVLEVRQHAAGRDVFEVVLENLIDQWRREVVQRQAGDHEVVRCVGLKFLQRGDVNFGQVRDSAQLWVGFETLPQVLGECFVQLDKVEAVALAQVPDDCSRDGSGAGADFEDSNGRVGRSVSQIARHRAGEKTAARRDRSGGFELVSELAEERRGFFE